MTLVREDTPAAPAAEEGLGYIRPLDGLRGVAVLGVLVEHFAPQRWMHDLSPGGIGVTAFFVLSGYLITRILVRYRRRGVGVGRAARHFYWRRFLRLSPPYYLALLVAALAGLQGVRHDWWVHAAYLTNVRIGLSGDWSGSATHFWSLATEEQFYLLWFFVVVLLPRRFLLAAVLAGAAVTLAFRTAVYAADLPAVADVLLPGNLVSLTLGGWIAHVELDGATPWFAAFLRRRSTLLLSTGLLAAVTASLPFLDWPRALTYPFVAALFSASLIQRCTDPGPDRTARVLGWTPLVRLGRISYGVFVYHIFVADLLDATVLGDHPLPGGAWSRFVVLCAASVAVAGLSWWALERRVLALKRLVDLGTPSR